ncbi:MAG: hypothetical protein JKY60_12630 [Kordiimonadaceae bacterium]|nr:hypothetical protein [Kordiimonadaceae bacterium]
MRASALKLFLYCCFVVGTPFYCAEASDEQDLAALELEALLREKIIPSNVLGTHTHMKGEWMIGYQYSFMDMKQLADGTQKLSPADVLADFNVTPTAMQMQMHMFHVMYAPSDDLTLFAMAGYQMKSMDHLAFTGAEFTTRSNGFSDVKIRGLYHLYRKRFDAHRVIFKAAISLPTGSITKQDFLANAAMGLRQLPYPMQIGSGTYDLIPGLKYVGTGDKNAWGADLDLTLRLGKNKNDYALGNIFEANIWYRHQLNPWLAPFLQLKYTAVGNVNGADTSLMPVAVPTNDPARYGYRRLNLQVGMNIFLQGALEGNKIALEASQPLYQSVNGPQLRAQWLFRGGWQWAF